MSVMQYVKMQLWLIIKLQSKIKVVRQLLPKEKGVLLNRLLNDINDADREAKYEAFEKGFLLGLFLAS